MGAVHALLERVAAKVDAVFASQPAPQKFYSARVRNSNALFSIGKKFDNERRETRGEG